MSTVLVTAVRGFLNAGTPVAPSGTATIDISVARVLANYGIVTFTDPGVPEVLLTQGSVPATSTSPGTPWQYASDGAYFYLCIAPNTWRRFALSDWS